MNDQTNNYSSEFACKWDAIPQEDRSRHSAVTEQLFHSVKQVKELSDGFAFELPSNALTLRQAAEFISREMLCCPFFRLVLEVEPESGRVWLKLTGKEGVKHFIHAELRQFVCDT
ncbi:hypothetical protein GQ464_009430 [Rhodocaloribacter litoris]|uniref:hypothetical protein n=1 Tax=Rhodocaloribacter litoris TaxID=2558931 RepID=UPI001420C200|nr:hypothetical protein [Rhodocaloribacter litoris]QXD13701.1 hypothetical protein GQ464_009430 [Rhodocaloribacter litoris]